jgi:hypothetical protein
MTSREILIEVLKENNAVKGYVKNLFTNHGKVFTLKEFFRIVSYPKLNISCAFVFASTPEKYNYWVKINIQYKAALKEHGLI